ncbi:uncharacterized protein LOC123011744 [Tribolium madens]|uniref:uncharacterized protein LOC123011744 n=1 Tax=Tribolium madens TaxID=41895 RepID=UPI001CF7226B|nr:uncharacterized protein LOC123011744 [Tribolium madens]
MSLKLVNLVFKFGSLLALTPAKIEKHGLGFPSKIYALLWIILFTAGVSISCIYRKPFYEEMTLVELILQVVTDVVLLILNISIITITATKKRQWQKFIKILKTLKINQENERKFWFLSFLLAITMYILSKIYETYIWSSVLGVLHYKMYAVEYFQFYAQFIVYYLIYVFLKLILNGVENLSKNIKLLKVRSNRLNSFTLKSIKREFCALSECINIFNNIFGWLILLLILFCFLQQLAYLHSLTATNIAENTVSIVIFKIMQITWHMVGTFISVFLCDLVEQRVKNMQMVAHEVAANCVGEKEYEEIKLLLGVINNTFPHFTAARYFNLNRKTILGILNALLTFLIVAIQFENSSFS